MGMRRSLMIIVVGPDDAPAAADALYQGGHAPLLGHDFPVQLTRRLLVRCDAVLRVGGRSPEADLVARLGAWEGKAVYYRVADVPAA
jgi:hypothetical protein